MLAKEGWLWGHLHNIVLLQSCWHTKISSMFEGFPDMPQPSWSLYKNADLNNSSITLKFILAPLTVARLCRGMKEKRACSFLKPPNVHNRQYCLSFSWLPFIPVNWFCKMFHSYKLQDSLCGMPDRVTV